MKWHLPNLSQLTEPMRSNFRLREYRPQASTLKVLHTLYPAVDWKRVDFYEGLPWYTPAVAPYVTAQALPDFYSFSRYRIYLKKFDEDRAQCIADIVHEAFHINQAMSFGKGYGIGFLRMWMVYYIAVFFKHGYRQNAFEVPAYDQEFRFLQYCINHNIHGISPKVPEGAFDQVGQEQTLIFNKIDFKYQESPLILIGSWFFCTFICLVRPIVDVLVFVLRGLVARHRD